MCTTEKKCKAHSNVLITAIVLRKSTMALTFDNGTWLFNCLNIIAPFKTTDSLRFQTLLPELYCELWQSNLTTTICYFIQPYSVYLTITYIYIYIPDSFKSFGLIKGKEVSGGSVDATGFADATGSVDVIVGFVDIVVIFLVRLVLGLLILNDII